jgi:hypothetical protein
MDTRALFAIGLALATSACTEATPPLMVAGVCGPPDDLVACKPPAGKCDTFLNGHLGAYTTVQVFAAGGGTTTTSNFLTAVAEVDNLAPDNSNTDIGRVNTRDAIITSAKVSYSGLGIGAVENLGLFTPVRAAGTATLFLPIVSRTTMAAIGAQMTAAALTSVEMVARITLVGHYGDGRAFEVEPYDVPFFAYNATFDATIACPDPTQARYFCYYPGQTGGEKCATPP